MAHIAEVDVRKLYLREAAPSMYAYCTERLHLSEAEAWLRIRVARASRKHPMILPMLRDGRLHLSGIVVLAPHLTVENGRSVLKRAVHKTKRQVEELVAEIAPREDAPACIRKLPERRGQLAAAQTAGLSPETGDAATAQLTPDTVVRPPARATTVEPLAPARFKIQFTANAELRDKLERLQALMRTSVPDGDLARVIDIAVTREIERIEGNRFGKTKNPRKASAKEKTPREQLARTRKPLAHTPTTARSRHIPAAVRRVVNRRDGSRCTYRDKQGRRCTKRHDLEFHDREPFGRGGDHIPENLALMCRAHNALLAEQDYGEGKMALFKRSPSRPPVAVSNHGAGGAPTAQTHPPG